MVRPDSDVPARCSRSRWPSAPYFVIVPGIPAMRPGRPSTFVSADLQATMISVEVERATWRMMAIPSLVRPSLMLDLLAPWSPEPLRR